MQEAHSKAFHSSSLFDRGQPILRAWTDSHGRSSQKPSGCRRLTSPSRPPASFGITKYKTHGKIHGRKSTFIRRIASRALVTSFESSCIKSCTRYPSGCTPVGIPQSASHNHSRIPLLKQHLENLRSLTLPLHLRSPRSIFSVPAFHHPVFLSLLFPPVICTIL